MARAAKLLLALVVGTAAVCTAADGRAQEELLRLGRADVVRLAREQNPDVVASIRRVDVSRGQLAGARVWLRQNPWIEAGAGPRYRETGRITDAAVSLAVPLEIYGLRGLEIQKAERSIARDQSRVDASRQSAVHAALLAYYRALRAENDIEWAKQQLDRATALLRTGERRREAGDIAEPEVAMLRVVAARARRASVATIALREMAHSELRTILGLPPQRAIALADALVDVRAYYSESLFRADSVERSEILVAERAVSAARSDIAAEERSAWPVPLLRSAYEREEGADLFFLSLGLSLPVSQRNQGAIAQARAQHRVAEAERDGLRLRVDNDLRAARARYRAALDALAVMELEALPAAETGLRLIQRSYEAGYADITNVLVTQRELADARKEYLDSLLELADAGLTLERALGRLP